MNVPKERSSLYLAHEVFTGFILHPENNVKSVSIAVVSTCMQTLVNLHVVVCTKEEQYKLVKHGCVMLLIA